jgi:predicted CoA-binding protein
MDRIPLIVSDFLSGKRIAVAGVSRDERQPANAIYRKLRSAGYEVLAVNPNASRVEGTTCYPTLAAIDGVVDGVVVAAPPAAADGIVGQCAERGIQRVWFHRSFGAGSVSPSAVAACHARGISCIVGGCPLMYCTPVDPVHRCMRWWLGRRGKVPR